MSYNQQPIDFCIEITNGLHTMSNKMLKLENVYNLWVV